MFRSEETWKFENYKTTAFQRKAAVYRRIKKTLNSCSVAKLNDVGPISRVIRTVVFHEEFALWLRIPSIVGGV